MDISYEELKQIERIGKLLGMSVQQVATTPYWRLLHLFADKVEGLNMINESHREMVADVKNLIKELEGVKNPLFITTDNMSDTARDKFIAEWKLLSNANYGKINIRGEEND